MLSKMKFTYKNKTNHMRYWYIVLPLNQNGTNLIKSDFAMYLTARHLI